MSPRVGSQQGGRRPQKSRNPIGFALLVVGGSIVGAIAGATLSPWPGALLIRGLFGIDTRRVERALENHHPGGIAIVEDEIYQPGDPDAKLDVYFPASTPTAVCLPTLVWTHGGAWLSGDKLNNRGYFALLASHGYAVVALNYSLAPGSNYPTPIYQVNAALDYLLQNSERLHIDQGRLMLAGDSAGAQISSQVALLVTSPLYARDLGVLPALTVDQLRGVIFYCGFYDMRSFIDGGRLAPIPVLDWGIRTMVRAYAGSRALDSAHLRQMSTIDHVTEEFPPTFLSGGNGDPLTDSQSRPMAEKLRGLGVSVATLFYAEDHRPELPHEYQFNLDGTDGQKALTTMLNFMDRCTAVFRD